MSLPTLSPTTSAYWESFLEKTVSMEAWLSTTAGGRGKGQRAGAGTEGGMKARRGAETMQRGRAGHEDPAGCGQGRAAGGKRGPGVAGDTCQC